MTEFRSLVDLASDAALAISSDSRVVAWNERATDLLGYTTEQVLGRPCYDILRAVLPSGEQLCTPACLGKQCFAHRSPFAIQECWLWQRDGRWLQASISSLVAPAPDRNIADAGAIAVIFLHAKTERSAGKSAAHELRICTLGRFALSVSGRGLQIERWYRKQALTLLKLLVTHRSTAIHREYVIECLWPDVEEHRGRERLKVTTYFLRQQLRAAGLQKEIIIVANETYALRRDGVWVDCEVFEDLFHEARLLEQRGRTKDALACLEKAARMYNGDYLPEERYRDWCAGERERLREIYFDVLGHMVESYLVSGEHEQAVRCCRLALSREPCRENFLRTLMTSLAHLGQYDRAIDHYRRFRQVLKHELGVEPAPETERIYRELLAPERTAAGVEPRH